MPLLLPRAFPLRLQSANPISPPSSLTLSLSSSNSALNRYSISFSTAISRTSCVSSISWNVRELHPRGQNPGSHRHSVRGQIGRQMQAKALAAEKMAAVDDEFHARSAQLAFACSCRLTRVSLPPGL